MTRHYHLLATLALAAVAVPAAAAEPPAGKTCIGNREIKEKRMAADTGYFVRTAAGWWHNQTSCPAFGQARSLITRSYNDRQCRGDVVDVFDPFSRITFGSCPLGAWEKVAGPPPKGK
ncbi:hypothetical protein [Sandarakinorhabdus sp. DWP1-3-1]|uniref:hypothetical protein n=1 Tax=Sandarakinorhabdus sp. DWP1-3-1 TaxID=2804627 RepID=UPI003CF9C815